MSTPFIGQIGLFGFSFAPRDWAVCNGQMMAIAQNQPLFALLSTQFGGNGTNNFALPDLQGRVPVGQGLGAGLPPRQMGQKFGAGSVTLMASQMPAHTHGATMHVTNAAGDKPLPGGHYLSGMKDTSGVVVDGYSDVAPDKTLASDAVIVAQAGGNLPFDVDQPSLVMNFCIALQGLFPSRN